VLAHLQRGQSGERVRVLRRADDHRVEALDLVVEALEFLVVGLVVTGVLATGAFAVQMWAQRLLPAQQVALLFAADPAVAAWLSWYFLGENLDAQGWFGSAMILGGVLLGAWVTGESSPAHQESSAARSEGG